MCHGTCMNESHTNINVRIKMVEMIISGEHDAVGLGSRHMSHVTRTNELRTNINVRIKMVN